MAIVADSSQFDQHTPALLGAGVAASDWSADDKNSFVDETKELRQYVTDPEKLLTVLAGRIENLTRRRGPIPGPLHAYLTDFVSGLRATRPQQIAFWARVTKCCDIPTGQGRSCQPDQVMQAPETPCTTDSVDNLMDGWQPHGRLATSWMDSDTTHYSQSDQPSFKPAQKASSWLGLQNHINTERNPLVIQAGYFSQFDAWMRHGATYGMETVRWHEIDWPGKAENAPETHQTGYIVKQDPNTGAAAIALYEASNYRIYLLLKHVDSTENGGRGWLTRKQVQAAFEASGYQVTARHRRRILERGDGLFWGRGQRGVIHLRKPEYVGGELMRLASERGLAVCELPGNRKPVYVDISQTHEAFEAQLYAAVITAHGGDWLASRELQSRIFYRSDDTIRKWERDRLSDTVTVKPCEAVADEDYSGPVPDHAYLKGGRWHWRIVNHYGCNLRQHNRKGRARRIHRRAEMAYLHSQPDVTHAVGSHAENRILYFRSEEKYKRVVKRHGIGSGRYLLQRAGTYRHTFKPMDDGTKADIFPGDRHA